MNARNAAQIKASLLAALAPHGKGAKIKALLKAGGYVVSYTAVSAGMGQFAWYFVPSGARLAKANAKPVLVASGRFSYSAAGAGRPKPKLTAAGKRLLRHTHLRLTARGTFTAAGGGGGAITAEKTFSLTR